MKTRGGIVLLFASALALLAAACGGGSETGATKVTVALDWFINPDHAGIVMAKAKGYFAEEGLDVTLQVPANPEDPPKFVATGRADIAISYEPDVLLARAEGIPIVAVGAIVPVPLNSIQALQSSGITQPQQLAGKTIGMPGLPANDVYLKTVLGKVGVSPAQVKTVDVGYDLLPALIGGRVDVTIGAYWNIEAVEAELQGKPVNIMRLEEWGVPTYDELVFIASEQSVAQKGDLLRRFLRAVARGHAAVVKDPDAAVEALLKESPELKREATEKQVRLLVPLWQKMEPFGQMSEASWRRFAEFLYDNKLVDKRVDSGKAMTNQFVPR